MMKMKTPSLVRLCGIVLTLAFAVAFLWRVDALVWRRVFLGESPKYQSETWWIREMGRGRVVWSNDGQEVLEVYIPNIGNDRSKLLTILRAFPHLKYLDLSDSEADDEVISEVATLASVERLNISYTNVTPRGLEFLEPMPNLFALDMCLLKKLDCSAYDPLVRLRRLKTLAICGSCGETITKRLRTSRPDLKIDF